MTKTEFKILMLRKGFTQKTLAEAIGCKQPNISQAISFYRPYKRIRKAMAKCLGVAYDELWPDKAISRKKGHQKNNC